MCIKLIYILMYIEMGSCAQLAKAGGTKAELTHALPPHPVGARTRHGSRVLQITIETSCSFQRQLPPATKGNLINLSRFPTSTPFSDSIWLIDDVHQTSFLGRQTPYLAPDTCRVNNMAPRWVTALSLSAWSPSNDTANRWRTQQIHAQWLNNQDEMNPNYSAFLLPSEMGLCGVWSNLSPWAEARLFSSWARKE